MSRKLKSNMDNISPYFFSNFISHVYPHIKKNYEKRSGFRLPAVRQQFIEGTNRLKTGRESISLPVLVYIRLEETTERYMPLSLGQTSFLYKTTHRFGGECIVLTRYSSILFLFYIRQKTCIKLLKHRKLLDDKFPQQFHALLL